jgi:replicative DNA helicase
MLRYDLEMEIQLLSACFCNREKAGQIIENVPLEAIYDGNNLSIYESIQSCFKMYGETTFTSVRADLIKRGKENALDYLSAIIKIPSIPFIKPAIDAVIEMYNRRRIDGVLEAAGTSEQESNDVAGTVINGLLEITKAESKYGEMLGAMLDRPLTLEHTYERTNVQAIDGEIKGFDGKRLIIIGARTSVGKTVMSTNIAVNMARKVPVLFFSLEQPREQIKYMILQMLSGVAIDAIRSGRMSPDESRRVQSAVVAGKNLDIEIFENVRHIDRINTIIRNKTAARKYGLVVIDYIQLIEVANKKQERRLQIAEASHILKAIANDTGVNIIAPAQLNRASENNDEPNMSDLRECGDLEQDADIVLLLYKQGKDSKDVWIKCDKNRMNGVLFKAQMKYNNSELRFISSTQNNWEDKARS